ncbi:hypothetical protein [Amycolatopsis dendrobii]|uniref:Uncharacterized protein n=1 Tax=Amycolatopsis dendrobii TaxID=2760662 RepID=A0A7W3VSN6_9PSEU|nr:hypothetical protein [Amycolatopsis dendrobii]MBB1152493.1 hypothetical protein [Amycolatopsis dendrobii]
MEELIGPLLVLFLILVVIGYLGYGLSWVATHYPILFWLGVAVLLVALSAYIYRRYQRKAELVRRADRSVGAAKIIQASARKTIGEVSRKRQEVINARKKVESIKRDSRGEANFHMLAAKHFESKQIADGYYRSMRGFAVSRDALAEQANEFGRHLKELTGARKGKSPRGKMADYVSSVKATASELRRTVDELRADVASLRTDVESYNDLTRNLKLHIRDTCGERGRRWYRELEERTRARKDS